MSFDKVDLSLPTDFQNIVRLFPLPNLVLFPGVIQALHLFEPRYRQLISDALDADGLISMALIHPNQSACAGQPLELFPTICIGKIITHAELDDGRYNLLLMGIRRAKIVREIQLGTLYRMAEVELQTDVVDGLADDDQALREKIIDQFRMLLSRRPQLDEESLDQLLNSDLPLGQLMDLVAYSSGASPIEQQSVLEEIEVRRRGELVLDLLRQQDANAADLTNAAHPMNVALDFPPGFSLN